jgi:predicted extracellular nuclease
VAHVETAQDENTFPNPYGEVKAIQGTGSKVLPRIEDVLQKEGVINL